MPTQTDPRIVVEFDFDVRWQVTAGDLNETGRRYYAAPPPYLAILVLREQIAQEMDNNAGNLYHTNGARKYVCLVGDHAATATPGYTLAQFAGYKHSKLSVLAQAEDTAPVDLKLSEFLAGAPTGDTLDPARRVIHPELVVVEGRIPLPLYDAMIDMVAQQQRLTGVSVRQGISDLIWQVLLEYVEQRV